MKKAPRRHSRIGQPKRAAAIETERDGSGEYVCPPHESRGALNWLRFTHPAGTRFRLRVHFQALKRLPILTRPAGAPT